MAALGLIHDVTLRMTSAVVANDENIILDDNKLIKNEILELSKTEILLL